MSRDAIKKALLELPDIRLPLPAALFDPAFRKILDESITTPELVKNFNRLTGFKLGERQSPIERMVDDATGFQDDAMGKFVEFVHDGIYLRMPSDGLHALRIAEMSKSENASLA